MGICCIDDGKMAKREGFGDILADGLMGGWRIKFGKGAEKYAVHIGAVCGNWECTGT